MSAIYKGTFFSTRAIENVMMPQVPKTIFVNSNISMTRELYIQVSRDEKAQDIPPRIGTRGRDFKENSNAVNMTTNKDNL